VAARSCSVAKIVFFATPFFVGRRVEICRAVEEANGGRKKWKQQQQQRRVKMSVFNTCESVSLSRQNF
jgi:hypothetical protein